MTAEEMRKISDGCSLRNHHPGPFKEFQKKYGDSEKYCEFNVEKELREYFTGNGFSFRYVTDDICGGVRQDPYWVICW